MKLSQLEVFAERENEENRRSGGGGGGGGCLEMFLFSRPQSHPSGLFSERGLGEDVVVAVGRKAREGLSDRDQREITNEGSRSDLAASGNLI